MLVAVALANVAYIYAIERVRHGETNLASIFSAEITGTLLATVGRQLVKKWRVLPRWRVLALMVGCIGGVLIFTQPWTAEADLLGLFAGFVMGLCIGWRMSMLDVSSMPTRDADIIKHSASLVAGLGLVVYAFVNGPVLLQELPVGMVALVILGCMLCGALTTGFPVQLEIMASKYKLDPGAQGIIYSTIPFVSARPQKVGGQKAVQRLPLGPHFHLRPGGLAQPGTEHERDDVRVVIESRRRDEESGAVFAFGLSWRRYRSGSRPLRPSQRGSPLGATTGRLAVPRAGLTGTA
jgi:hypothetical protein